MYQLHISFNLTERTLVLDIGEKKDAVKITKQLLENSYNKMKHFIEIKNLNKGSTWVNCENIESVGYFNIETSVRRVIRYQEKSEKWQKDESNKIGAGFATH